MMEVLEQYEELVERSPSDISYVWKGVPIVAYFLSSVSAYACSILFSILWVEICGGHCYIWSDIRYYKRHEPANNESLKSANLDYDWTKDLVVSNQSHFYCNTYHFSCLISCAVAAILLTMFLICGKGGYDSSLQVTFFIQLVITGLSEFSRKIKDFAARVVAPWRLVPPALIGSFIMMIMTMTVASSFARGYFHFSEKLYQLAYHIMKHANAPFKYKRPCEVFQQFSQSHNSANYDACLIYWMIQMCSWTMTWSWIGSFSILVVRILMSADFNLLKVKIYALPEPGPERDTILKIIGQGKHSLTLTRQSRDDDASTVRRRDSRKEKVL